MLIRASALGETRRAFVTSADPGVAVVRSKRRTL